MGIERRWLGTISYDEAHQLQRSLLANRINGMGRDTLLLLEHEPVITLGQNADPTHLLFPLSSYEERGIAVRQSERGGEVTYHGPGHLVMYPIIALRERGITLRQHIRALEGALIAACAAYRVKAERRDGAPGCWVGERKIGAVGVRVERGVAWHGLALNVGRDVAAFEMINPCGHAGVVSTSIALERDWAAISRGEGEEIEVSEPQVNDVAALVANAYEEELLSYAVPDRLGSNGTAPAVVGGSR